MEHLILLCAMALMGAVVAHEPTADPVSDTPATETPELNPAVETPPSPDAEETGEPGAAEPAEIEEPLKPPEPTTDELKKSLQAVARERSEAEKKAKALESELETLRTEKETPTAPESDYKDAGTIHPRLKGMAYDPADETVEIARGQWRTVREAKAMVVAEDMATRIQESELAGRQAEVREQRDVVYTSIKTDSMTACKAAFPNASEKVLSHLDGIVRNGIAMALQEAGIPPDFDPYQPPDNFTEVVAAGQVRGLADALEFMVEAQTPQKIADKDAADKQPVSTGGKAASVVGKSLAELTPDQLAEHDDNLLARVKSKFGFKT